MIGDYKGKRVLVTGAGGFIGSHLTERLVEIGAKTSGFVHYNALGGEGWLSRSEARGKIHIIAGDLCDRDCVAEAVKHCDVVFHLAALIAIPYSYHAPASYVRTNVEGTLNILQACRMAKVQRIVHTSTSEVYGTAKYVPIDEEHPLQGQSPYAASKIAGDKLAEAFHLSFDLPVATVRPFNTFGPRQSARAVIPTIITQCLKSEAICLGSLTPTRDMNYVSNTVDGFLLAGLHPAAVGRIVNLGSGREISVGALARLIAEIAGSDFPILIEPERKRPPRSEVERLLADNTLAQELMGWKPEIDLEEGLLRTVQWVKKSLEYYPTGTYVV